MRRLRHCWNWWCRGKETADLLPSNHLSTLLQETTTSLIGAATATWTHADVAAPRLGVKTAALVAFGRGAFDGTTYCPRTHVHVLVPKGMVYSAQWHSRALLRSLNNITGLLEEEEAERPQSETAW